MLTEEAEGFLESNFCFHSHIWLNQFGLGHLKTITEVETVICSRLFNAKTCKTFVIYFCWKQTALVKRIKMAVWH